MCGSAIALITTTTTTTVVAGGEEPGTAAGLAGPSRVASVSRTATVHGTGIEKGTSRPPKGGLFLQPAHVRRKFLVRRTNRLSIATMEPRMSFDVSPNSNCDFPQGFEKWIASENECGIRVHN